MGANLNESDSSSRSGIQVISRAVSILRSLKNQSGGLTLGQIAGQVGLPRSTVQRIVGALQAEHLVIAASPGRGIRLGPEISALAESARIDIGELLRPYLVELANNTGETVDLATIRGEHLVFIDQIPGHHRLRTVSFVGEAFPLFDTANGKACLAAMDRQRVLKLLAAENPERAEAKAYVEGLLTELEQVRSSRIAFDRDQHTDGISAVGAAFCDLHGEIYAISIPTPSPRFALNEDHLKTELRRTLEQIEALEVVGEFPTEDLASTGA